MEKKSISPLFHNIFNISRISRVKLYLHLLNVVVRFIFSPILQFWYVEVRISRSISESPLDFKITRVDCICMHVYVCFNCLIFYQFMFHCHLPKQWKWYKVCTSTDLLCVAIILFQMNSDYGYVAPHIKMSEKLSAQGVKVWLYDFTYRSKNSIHPEWMGRLIHQWQHS